MDFVTFLNTSGYSGTEPKIYILKAILSGSSSVSDTLPFPSVFEGFSEVPPYPDPNLKLGDAHQQLLNHSFRYGGGGWETQSTKGRSNTGAHFTPYTIIDELVRPSLGCLFAHYWETDPDSYLESLHNMKVLDPAMGAGDLLVQAALEITREKAWFELYGEPRFVSLQGWEEPLEVVESFPASHELEELCRKHMVPTFLQSIFGVDIDPVSVEIAKITVLQFSTKHRAYDLESLAGLETNLKKGNALLGYTSISEVKHALSPYMSELTSSPLSSWFEIPEINYEDPFYYDLALVFDFVKNAYKRKEGDTILSEVVFNDSPTLDAILRDERLRQDCHSRILDWYDKKSLSPIHWELAFPQLFPMQGNHKEKVEAGVDCIVANPPFIGDRKLRGRIGKPMVEYLANRYTEGNTPDYCGFFFLRFTHLASTRGVVGTLGPNSIAQASNRDYITKRLFFDDQSFRAYRGMPNRPWPGDASVHYCMIHMARPKMVVNQKPRLVVPVEGDTNTDRWTVRKIDAFSSYLDEYPEFDLKKIPSMKNGKFVFKGVNIRGAKKADFDLVKPLSFNDSVSEVSRQAIRAAYTSKSLQHYSTPTPTKIVIDFYDVLSDAQMLFSPPSEQEFWLRKHFKELMDSINGMKAHRAKLKGESYKRLRDYWWRFDADAIELRENMKSADMALLFGETVKVWSPQIVNKKDKHTGLLSLFTHGVYVCPASSNLLVGMLISEHFEILARRQCSTFKSDLRFTPSEVFPYFSMPWRPWFDDNSCQLTSFPEPESASVKVISKVAKELVGYRALLLEQPMSNGFKEVSQWGPTKLYNLYDNEEVELEGIERLRQLHVDLFQAVLRAYGWDDLAEKSKREDWGFERPWLDRTMRFVPSEEVRAEVYRRMGELNAERYRYELGLFLERAMLVMSPGHELSRNQVAEAMEAKYCPDAAGDGKSLDHDVLEAALEMGVEEGKLMKGTGYMLA